MLATVLHRPRDIRCEEVAEPKIQFPTDAIIQLSATCICGSDLWPYRGLNEVDRADARWATNIAASSWRSAARCEPSGRVSSSSARSSSPTTPARIADSASSPPACIESS